MIKKILLLFLCFMIGIEINAQSRNFDWKSGKVTWEYDSIAGVLTIRGTGKIFGEYWSEKKREWIRYTPWLKYQKQIKRVVIGSGITTVGDHAFSSYSNLHHVDLPEGLTEIGPSAFCDCGLASIVIPSTVVSIGESAFRNCRQMGTVKMKPTTLKELGVNAFYNCESLYEIVIPKGITAISAFDGCKNLTKVTLPDGIKSIGSSAFYGCGKLSSINIPTSIEKVGPQAFYECYKMKGSLNLPNLKELDLRAFSGTDIVSITIPEGIKTIKMESFQGCRSMKTVSLPSTLKEIESNAFYGCEKLTVVKCYAVIPPKSYHIILCGDKPQNGITVHAGPSGLCPDLSKTVLYVPKGSAKAYAEHKAWSNFGSIIEM